MNSGAAIDCRQSPEHPRRLVCLVDGDTVLAEIERFAVSRGGYEVIAFSDPLECLAWIRQAAPLLDVLVTAYALPVITGAELIRRAKVVVPTLKTILTSGYEASQLPDLEMADVFLAKPFTMGRLVEAVAQILV